MSALPGGGVPLPPSTTDRQTLSPTDAAFLFGVQRQALRYFLDNQTPGGLVLDRQRNHGPRLVHGLCSTSATGMGLIALALAAAPPYRLLSPRDAVLRVSAGVRAALDRLPHDHGVVPHFIDSSSGAVVGADCFSTIETAWLAAGALWAAAFLQDSELEGLARRLSHRVDWHHWTGPEEKEEGRRLEDERQESEKADSSFSLQPSAFLIRHGKGRDGHFLRCSWDRVNGETAFMYVLAAGAEEGRAVSGAAWKALRPFYGEVAGRRINNADLGLFVFQYSLDLLDLRRWRAPGEPDLHAEAKTAAEANQTACREAADRFTTYRRFWGLSAGDGPGQPSGRDVYRCYAPAGPIDGTAHLTAALASVAHCPAAVLHNLYETRHDRQLPARGRYGFSSINLDHGWVGRDMVGIDAGAAVLALDNYLMHDRVRSVFHGLGCIRRGLERLGFTPHPESAGGADQPPVARRAS